MTPNWLVLLPPLVVMLVAFLSKRLHISLLLGMISAAVIAKDGSIFGAISLLVTRLTNQLHDIDNVYLYSFLFILGIVTLMLELSGGARAFAQALSKHIHSAKAAELTSVGISFLFGIDDYLSCLTTGSIMRPLTDRFGIPRAKLAYLVHSLTSPLVMITPISTWVAMITSQLDQAGISQEIQTHTKVIADPYLVYAGSIPYIFYSIILVFSVIFIVLLGIQFGPMASHEKIAKATGNLWGGDAPIEESKEPSSQQQGAIIDLVLPIVVLIGSFLAGLLYMGDFWLFGGVNSFIGSIQKTQNTSLVLFVTSLATFGATILLGFLRKTLTFKKLLIQTKQGIEFMIPSIGIVFLAATLGIMMRVDLGTGAYLADLLSGTLPIILLPLSFYLVSLAVSLITGSAWGTIGLMVPIGVQMTVTFLGVATPAEVALVPLLYPVLGAIFSGAVCGNHISPVAELTVMSATSTGSYPLAHSITQIWYAIPVVLGACGSYLMVGLLSSWNSYVMLITALCAGIGIFILIVSMLTVLEKFLAKK